MFTHVGACSLEGESSSVSLSGITYVWICTVLSAVNAVFILNVGTNIITYCNARVVPSSVTLLDLEASSCLADSAVRVLGALEWWCGWRRLCFTSEGV